MKPVRYLILAVLVACATGCAVGPNYHAPKTQTPADFAALPTAGKQSVPTTQPAVDIAQWWHVLRY
jgi:outer membrane protein TolC